MMSPADKLVYMANQIARNFAVQGTEAAALATADHLAAFWDPRMRATLLEMEAPPLDPIAAKAAALLRERAAVPPQSPATVFAGGGSDAG